MPTFPGADGQTLTYRERGEGRPLVLLHGFLLDGTHWLNLTEGLNRRLILPDLRGHGKSALHKDTYQKDILPADALALISHLGLTDYDLGGYSLGARIVIRMLAKGAHPRRAVVGGQGLTSVTGVREGANRRALTAMTSGTPPQPEDEETAHWIRASGNDPAELLAVLNSITPTPESALGNIETPTLVAVGTEDKSQSTADALAKALPNAKFVEVPGNHYTAMANMMPAMRDFLA